MSHQRRGFPFPDNWDLDQVSEFIDKTADIIERDGWCQGHAHQTVIEQDGSVRQTHCVLGGMQVAVRDLSGKDVNVHHQWLRVKDQAKIVLAWLKFNTSIPEWNDTPGRTKQEVLDNLRDAAKEVRMPHEG